MRSKAAVLLVLASIAALLVPQAFATKGVHHSFSTTNSIGGLSLDPGSGDIWAQGLAEDKIERYNQDGSLDMSFGSNGAQESQFSFNFQQSQIATDSAANLYVADSGNNRIQAFDSTGAFIGTWGWGVDDGSAELQNCTSGCEAGQPGNGAGQLSGPQGIAVDPVSGDVYVADTGNARVLRFSSAGALLDEIGSPGTQNDQFSSPTRVGLDSTGKLYVLDPSANNFNGRITKWAANGELQGVFAAGEVISPSEIAIDPSTDHLYAAAREHDDPENIEDGRDGILEFSSAGDKLDLHAPRAGFFATGLALDPAGNQIYVADSSRVLVLADVPLPVVAIDPVVTFDDHSATFSGTVNPEGVEASYYFQYSGDGGATWRSAPGVVDSTGDNPSPAPVGNQTTPQPVSQSVSGLDPNHAYLIRLIGSRDFNSPSATSTEETFTTDKLAAYAATLSAGPVTATTATLAAKVNSHNSLATYQFEWGASECSSNPCASLPAAAAPLGSSDNAIHFVTEQLSGLQPQTTYHFRVLATNTDTSEVSEGQDRTFRTLSTTPPPAPTCTNATIRSQQGAEFLPDCRAYEKVSPDDKGGFDVFARSWHVSSADGNRVTYTYNGTPPGGTAGNPLSQQLATRGAGGWSQRFIEPPMPGGINNTSQFMQFSEDLTKSVVLAHSALTPDATNMADQLYLRDNAADSYQLLTPVPPPPPGFFPAPRGTLVPGAASADFSHIAYESAIPQTPPEQDPVTGISNAYEWVDGQGVRLVGLIDPDGPGPLSEAPAPDGSKVGSGDTFGSARHAVSADGSRVVFHAVDLSRTSHPEDPTAASSSSVAGQLYVRDDQGTPSSADDATVHVSASQRTDCAGDSTCGGDGQADPAPDPAGPLPALYYDAEVAHGDKVLFTSCEKLTDDSTADVGGSVLCQRGDISEAADLAPQRSGPGRDLYLYDVDSGQLTDLTTADPSGAGVAGVLGASEDLDTVYFVALGVLDPGSDAISGQANLYRWHDGVTTFIATLDSSEPLSHGRKPDSTNWSFVSAPGKEKLVRVAPDGAHLVFTSLARLSGYDNRNPSACPPTPNPITPANVEGRCAEIYLYDAAADRLTCVSCSPSGAAPTGDALLAPPTGSPINHSGDPFARNLAEDGSYLFFETPDALLPADTNGRRDVYQWREGGHLGLISSGKGAIDSGFVDASASGNDVFFTTYDHLASTDLDTSRDLYDARVGGGGPPEPTPPPACEGDACQPPPVVPNDPTPASSGFQGPGDAKPKKVKKAKKHAKKRHRKQGKQTKKSKGKANNNRRASR